MTNQTIRDSIRRMISNILKLKSLRKTINKPLKSKMRMREIIKSLS